MIRRLLGTWRDPRTRPPAHPFVTGVCICCKGRFKIRPDGNVRVHGLMHGALCLGSDRPPEVDLW